MKGQARLAGFPVPLVSLKNLLTFPFIQNSVLKQKITLHGLWHEIDTGNLFHYDSELKDFKII